MHAVPVAADVEETRALSFAQPGSDSGVEDRLHVAAVTVFFPKPLDVSGRKQPGTQSLQHVECFANRASGPAWARLGVRRYRRGRMRICGCFGPDPGMLVAYR